MGLQSESRILTDLNIATRSFYAPLVSQINRSDVMSARLLAKSKACKGGDRIAQPLEYGEEHVDTQGKYDLYNLQPVELIDSAFFNWKLVRGDMVLSEFDMDVANQGKEAILNLAEIKMKNLGKTFKKKFSELLFKSSIGSKDPESLVTIAGTSGNTVGGINGATYTADSGLFNWNPQVLDLSSQSMTRADLLDPSHTNCIDKILRKIVGRLTYGNADGPTILLVTQGLFDVYEEFLQAQKRYEGKAGKADGGFQYLLFRNIPIFVDDNVPGGKLTSTADGGAMGFCLNENYLYYRHSSQINFKLLPWKKKEDQDVFFSVMKWWGAFTCSRRDRQGCVQGLPTDAELNAA